jgi:hypothetical protein
MRLRILDFMLCELKFLQSFGFQANLSYLNYNLCQISFLITFGLVSGTSMRATWENTM